MSSSFRLKTSLPLTFVRAGTLQDVSKDNATSIDRELSSPDENEANSTPKYHSHKRFSHDNHASDEDGNPKRQRKHLHNDDDRCPNEPIGPQSNQYGDDHDDNDGSVSHTGLGFGSNKPSGDVSTHDTIKEHSDNHVPTVSKTAAEEPEEDYMSSRFLETLAKQDEEEKRNKLRSLPSSLQSKIKSNMAKSSSSSTASPSSTSIASATTPSFITPPSSFSSHKSILAHTQASLSRPLDESNKGHALLMKMGYKEGQGLGKSQSGRTEPIPIHITQTKSGLGREEFLLSLKQQHTDRLTKLYKLNQQKFIDGQKRKFLLRKYAQELEQLCRICQTKDEKAGISSQPLLNIIQPSQVTTPTLKQESANTSTSIPPTPDLSTLSFEQLSLEECMSMSELINSYLQRQYHYCFYCGIDYQDQADLAQHCPGTDKNSHDA